jgi:hypothetical protein
MKQQTTYLAVFGVVLMLVGGGNAAAQQVRSFTSPSREREQKSDVPRAYLPPRGMCRIWVDSVPAKQQPAPTDCTTAIRNKPRNGRVIFGEDAGDDGKKDKDAKDKPKKPGARDATR